MNLETYPLSQLADRVGTPFFLLDAEILRGNLGRLAGPGRRDRTVVARYAMKGEFWSGRCGHGVRQAGCGSTR